MASVFLRCTPRSSAPIISLRAKYARRSIGAARDTTTIGLLHRFFPSTENSKLLSKRLAHIAAQQSKVKLDFTGAFINGSHHQLGYFVKLSLASSKYTRLQDLLKDELSHVLTYQTHFPNRGPYSEVVPLEENKYTSYNGAPRDMRLRTHLCNVATKDKAELILRDLKSNGFKDMGPLVIDGLAIILPAVYHEQNLPSPVDLEYPFFGKSEID